MAFYSAILRLRVYAELQGLFYKSPKFKNEKEYRIVISIAEERIQHKNNQENHKYFGDNNKKLLWIFSLRGGLITPYLFVVLPKEAISRVYIF